MEERDNDTMCLLHEVARRENRCKNTYENWKAVLSSLILLFLAVVAPTAYFWKHLYKTRFFAPFYASGTLFVLGLVIVIFVFRARNAHRQSEKELDALFTRPQDS